MAEPQPTNCRTCKRKIVWLSRDDKGGKIAVDPFPHPEGDIQALPGARCFVFSPEGLVSLRKIEENVSERTKLYRRHECTARGK